MNESAGLLENVRQVLMSDWDPIGIRDVSEARDEYDDYARQIVRRLAAGASTAELCKRLLEIETAAMGLPGNRERANEAARKLWRIANP